MYLESIREMNDAERDVLRERLSGASPVSGRSTVKGVLVCFGGTVLVVLLGAGVIALKPNPVVSGLTVGVLFFIGIIGVYALIAQVSSFFRWRNSFKRSQRDAAPLIRKTLEEGKVHSKRVIASGVIEILEFEDEGPGYIFDIGEGKSLLLKGRQYVPAQAAMPWPASEFDIVRGADRGLWIGLFSTGKPLHPARTVPMEDCREEFVWSEQEVVLTGSPETVLQGILETARPAGPRDGQ